MQAGCKADVLCLLTDVCGLRRVVRYRALADEFGAAHSIALRQALCAEDSMANAGLYVLLRAVDRFHETHQRFPGSFDG